jgi:hypothetical protein
MLCNFLNAVQKLGSRDMPLSDELHQLLRFRPHPGPTPDPASLLQFFVDFEHPVEARQQAFAAFLNYSLEGAQAQVKFVQALQKAAAGRPG